MKQDGDTIGFTMSFAEYPQEFANFGGAEFIRETTVNSSPPRTLASSWNTRWAAKSRRKNST